MSWTAPMTAVSNTAFTAAQFNTYIRDNLMETAPALASASGQMFVADGANSIAVRAPAGATVSAAQTTNVQSFTDLATVGPSVTVATGKSAIVSIAVNLSTNTDNTASTASYAVSGATTIAASGAWGVVQDGVPADNSMRCSAVSMQSGLNPGNNTFTMKYLAGGGSTPAVSTFRFREIVVIPL